MARVIAGMTISLDGFVADRNGSAERLYPDFAAFQDSPYMKSMIAETGAVIMGKRTVEMAGDLDLYADSYEFQVPIFVVTHHPPETMPKQNDHLTFTFVTDGVESAVEQAAAAAGDKAVTVVGGAMVNQELLLTGLVDELPCPSSWEMGCGSLRTLRWRAYRSRRSACRQSEPGPTSDSAW